MDKYKKIAEYDGVKVALAIFTLPRGVVGEWRVEEVQDSTGADKLWTRTVYHEDRPVVRARSNGGGVAWVTRNWVEEAREEGEEEGEDIATLIAMQVGL